MSPIRRETRSQETAVMIIDLRSALTLFFVIVFTTVSTSFGIYFVIESKIKEANAASVQQLTKSLEDLAEAAKVNMEGDRALALRVDSRLNALSITIERLTEASSTQLMLIKENSRRIDQVLTR